MSKTDSRRKLAKCVLVLLLTINVLSQSVSVAFDATDTKPPSATITQVQTDSIPNGFILFQVDVVDDKNRLIVNVSQYPARAVVSNASTFPQGLAPVCNPGGREFAKVLLVENGNKVVVPDPLRPIYSSSRIASYLLVFEVGQPRELPKGCPEWRDSSKWFVGASFVVRDEAGNESLISTGSVSVSPGKGNLCFEFSDLPSSSTYDSWAELLSQVEELKRKFPQKVSEMEAWRDWLSMMEIAVKNYPAYANFMSMPFAPMNLSALPRCGTGVHVDWAYLDLSASVADFRAKLAESLIQEEEAAAAAAEKAAARKPASITCVRGKQVLKVSGKNPKCPKGYIKK